MKTLFMLVIAAGLSVGCIKEPTAQFVYGAPIGASPPSPALVSSCETTRTWQNIWTLSGSLFGAAAGGVGTVETVSDDKRVQTGIAIGAGIAGLLAAVSTAASGIDSSNYASDNCPQILQQAVNASSHQ